ncbi:toll/interleukin-1 receptor domain-containing protein [Sulfurimonas sp. HSL1-6]|uniref:toll/interleukin-1 receptor domain-containing protein n=1 Tax=Thiomicrolovo immobilis TaxID=3131935 RepID=UPI0031F87221
MSSAFISYSVKDEQLARSLYSATTMAGIETFLASISIEAGSHWTTSIFKNLEQADWVFFLASKNSISSAAVQQELGASLVQKKTIIPLLIDISPEELPGWVGNHQAIDLKSSPKQLHEAISKIAEKIKVDKFWAGLIVGAIVIGLLMLITKK